MSDSKQIRKAVEVEVARKLEQRAKAWLKAAKEQGGASSTTRVVVNELLAVADRLAGKRARKINTRIEEPAPEPVVIEGASLFNADNIHVLRSLPSCSVDALVIDPPSGIAFMAKQWDRDKGGRDGWVGWFAEVMAECYRVMKPGAHALVWALPRTSHWTCLAVEQAEFEIRDILMHIFGTGFPKSTNVGLRIDAEAGATREVVGSRVLKGNAAVSTKEKGGTYVSGARLTGVKEIDVTAPATDDAKRWDGWGTALKPSHEMWVLAVKPTGTSDILRECLEHIEGVAKSLASTAEKCADCHRVESRAGKESTATESARPQHNETCEVHETPTGKAGGLSDPMATSQCESATCMSLSIVQSWLDTLIEISEAMSMCTTATVSSTTTALKTLRSCLLQITPESIIKDVSSPSGASSAVTGAAILLNDVRATLIETLTRSARANAIAQAISSLPSENDLPPAVYATMTGHSDNSSHEAWILARKPLAGTVAANVLAHGTGALNIDGCRVGTDVQQINAYAGRGPFGDSQKGKEYTSKNVIGRWPPHLLLTHAAACGETCADGCPVAELDAQSGVSASGVAVRRNVGHSTKGLIGYAQGSNDENMRDDVGYGDAGGASRFFPIFRYSAKPSTRERNAGCDAIEPRQMDTERDADADGANNPRNRGGRVSSNHHPTLKSIDLMRWLVRLITPPNGVVLDCFMGSGTTGIAATLEGARFIGIEREPDYFEIACARIEHHMKENT